MENTELYIKICSFKILFISFHLNNQAVSGGHILSSYCFHLFKLPSLFRLVRMATLDTSFQRKSLRKLFLTAQAVNLQFSLNVAIFDEESISNRLTSRYSEVHYTFAVKGICALFLAVKVFSWLVKTFKTRSGTRFHGYTFHPHSHTYPPLPQIVCL